MNTGKIFAHLQLIRNSTAGGGGVGEGWEEKLVGVCGCWWVSEQRR